jgi:hypothetical protein
MRRMVLAVAVLIVFGVLSSSSRLSSQQPGQNAITSDALAQIQALIDEKASRTPEQLKLDSQLVYAVKMARGETIARGLVPQLQVNLGSAATDAGRVIVVGRRGGLLRRLTAMGTNVMSSNAA